MPHGSPTDQDWADDQAPGHARKGLMCATREVHGRWRSPGGAWKARIQYKFKRTSRGARKSAATYTPCVPPLASLTPAGPPRLVPTVQMVIETATSEIRSEGTMHIAVWCVILRPRVVRAEPRPCSRTRPSSPTSLSAAVASCQNGPLVIASRPLAAHLHGNRAKTESGAHAAIARRRCESPTPFVTRATADVRRSRASRPHPRPPSAPPPVHCRCGLLLQHAYRDVLERGFVPPVTRVYISFYLFGSPAHKYKLVPKHWVSDRAPPPPAHPRRFDKAVRCPVARFERRHLELGLIASAPCACLAHVHSEHMFTGQSPGLGETSPCC